MRARLLSILVLAPSLLLGLPGRAEPLEIPTDIDVEIPDLADIFHARPPMGDCPLGGAEASEALPESAHLLHLGVAEMYLDHRRRLHLSEPQVDELRALRDGARATWRRDQDRIDDLEARLWNETGAEEPSLARVEETLRELEELHTAQRLSYIHAVWSASHALTEAQRQALVGPR